MLLRKVVAVEGLDVLRVLFGDLLLALFLEGSVVITCLVLLLGNLSCDLLKVLLPFDILLEALNLTESFFGQ